MNKEDIIRMAREAGELPDPMVFIAAYERFAALVAAHEREACAKVCESRYIADGSHEDVASSACAAAIRARGQA